MIRINKYPFFLWLTKETKLDIDLNNMTVKNKDNEESSKIEKVSIFTIFFMKYLPIVFLLYWFNIPTTLLNIELCLIAAAITALTTFVFLKFPRYFSKFVIAVTICCLYLIWTFENVALYLDYIMLQIVQLTMIFILIRDILFKKGYKNYYHLMDKKLEARIDISKKHKRPLLPLVPWTNIGLFKVERGLNLGFNASIVGYYIRIEDEK